MKATIDFIGYLGVIATALGVWVRYITDFMATFEICVLVVMNVAVFGLIAGCIAFA